jgi:uncharacterized phage protein (TIGR02220 family)
MFSLKIIDTDLFLDMPQSARLLYYDLSMRADDDGFVASPKKIQRMIGCSDDDLKILIAKQFIIPFESGICVIKHWRIHNYIRSDRYAETLYKEERQLLVETDGTYELNGIPNVIPSVNQMSYQRDTQDRLGKDRLSKDKDIDIIPYQEIIEFLNYKASTAYKYTSKKTKELIKARWNERFTLEDFKAVINKKCAEWLGTEYEKFLRPETIFGTKFENYLNQKGGQHGRNTSNTQQSSGKFAGFKPKQPDTSDITEADYEGLI